MPNLLIMRFSLVLNVFVIEILIYRYGGNILFYARNMEVQHKYSRVFVSGCISGLVVSLIDTPFDLVKTQLQNQGLAEKIMLESTQ